jgi:hypothetical protein
LLGAALTSAGPTIQTTRAPSYLSGQKSIAATFNTDIEVITPDLQKIQFDSSGQ